MPVATIERQAHADAAAELARLAEQVAGLQRELLQMHVDLDRSEARARDLTDAKFVTYRTLIDSQADKVKLALEATEKAIEKAERATEKAIDKAEIANNNRFEAVNEFRAQLADLIAKFATLERVDLLYNQTRLRMDEINNNLLARLSDLSDRVTELSTQLGNRVTAIEANKQGGVDMRALLFSAVFLVIAVFGVWTATHR